MEYVILDIETTGLDPEHSSIIEIGAILVSGNKIKKEFQTFVKYEEQLPDVIKKLTGINEDSLRDAPTLEVAIGELKKFVEKFPVVSHNGFRFDFPMLEKAGLKFTEKHDSLEYAFFVLPTNELGHSAPALAKKFQLGEIPHRALEDCKQEFNIILKLIEEYGNRPKDRTKALKFLAEKIGWWWATLLPGQGEPFEHISDFVEAHVPYRKKDASQDKLVLGTQKIGLAEMEQYFLPQKIHGARAAEYAEDRPEQRKMAAMVGNAFNEHKHLVIEAGTGTGKSKAYLVPSVLFALKNGIPVVVATHTKALQDQLFFKEIIHLKEIVNPDLRVAVIKGKKNYVCLKKFEEFLEEVVFEFSQRSLYEFGKTEMSYSSRLACLLLASWILETQRGDWDELPYWLKERFAKRVEQDVCNSDELCTKDVCEFHDQEKCFFAKARLRAKDADLVVANHAIVLSGIIPANESEEAIVGEESSENAHSPYAHAIFPSEAKFLVIDEAHHLEDDATSAWTHILSKPDFELLFEQLYGKRGVKNLIQTMATGKNSKTVSERAENFYAMESNTKLAIETFFKNVLPELVPESTYEGGTSYRSFEEIDQNPEHKKVFFEMLKDLEERMRSIALVLKVFSDEADSEQAKKILTIRVRNVEKTANTLAKLLDNDSFYVKYLERTKSFIEVKAAPLSVAAQLKEMVYDNFSSVVLTSATITVERLFNFFAKRCGTSLLPKEQVSYTLLPSSFDYKKQAQFFVTRDISYNHNQTNRDGHLNKCADFLKEAVVASNGGALILCSSHKQVDTLFKKLYEPLARKNIMLLRQSKGMSVSSVIRDFTEDVNSVLIGTETLWQGVDVPGDSLRALFILKIPYRMPNVPIIKARRMEIDRKGRSGSSEYYMPLAAIALKQGFGRLIRKATDRGIAVMLDDRLMRTPMLLKSFPDGVQPMVADEGVIIAALEEQTSLLMGKKILNQEQKPPFKKPEKDAMIQAIYG